MSSSISLKSQLAHVSFIRIHNSITNYNQLMGRDIVVVERATILVMATSLNLSECIFGVIGIYFV